jgi:hypothetical protein
VEVPMSQAHDSQQLLIQRQAPVSTHWLVAMPTTKAA